MSEPKTRNRGKVQPDGFSAKPFYSIADIAQRWGVSEQKVTRHFENEKDGLMNLGTPADVRKRKRAFRILRVTAALLARVEKRLTA